MFTALLVVVLTLNSNTTCQTQLTVRQNGRFVTTQQLEGYSNITRAVNVESNEPLEISVSSRVCNFRPYRITADVFNRKVTVEFGTERFMAFVR